MKRSLSLGALTRLIILWLLLLFLLLPVFMIIPFSFANTNYLSFPKDGLSLAPYFKLFGSSEWLASFVHSLVIAGGATFFAVLIGASSAIGLWRIDSPWVNVIRGVALTPLILPQILTALAFYRLFIDIQLLDTRFGVMIAHGILGSPLVLITVTSSLAAFDMQIERAARSLGANLQQTLWRIILPNIWPGVASGAVFAFLISWDELVVTLFITGINIITLPRRIWSGLREDADPTIAAVATLLILLTVIIGITHFVRVYRQIRRGEYTE